MDDATIASSSPCAETASLTFACWLTYAIVREVIRVEQLQVQALAYDTTNFYTHIASTNLKPQLPQRGHNKQGRHDLRQLGLALVVDQATQLPLGVSAPSRD